MKLDFFHSQQHSIITKPYFGKEKDHLPAIQECSEDSSNQSIVSVVKQKNGSFLLRIIRRCKNGKQNQGKKKTEKRVSPTSSRTSSSPTTTTTTSSTKENNNTTRQLVLEYDAPLSFYDAPISFVRINPRNARDDESSQQRESFIKLTSKEIITEHGLENNDSIIAYFKDVNEAYNHMVMVFDDNDNDATLRNHSYDNCHDGDEDDYYSNAVDQSISLITMDPAIAYSHSIAIMDEFSLISKDYYENSDGEEEIMKPLRYYHI